MGSLGPVVGLGSGLGARRSSSPLPPGDYYKTYCHLADRSATFADRLQTGLQFDSGIRTHRVSSSFFLDFSVLLPLLVPLADEIELASMENFDVNTMVAIAPHTVILAVASDLHPLIFAPKAKLCLDPVSQLSLQANTITKCLAINSIRRIGLQSLVELQSLRHG